MEKIADANLKDTEYQGMFWKNVRSSKGWEVEHKED